MKLIAVLFTSLVILSSCSEDPVATNNNTSASKPWVEIRPDSLHGLTYVTYDFIARVNNFDQDELRLDWYFGEGDTLKAIKNGYYNDVRNHRFDKPGQYQISVTAVDLFADTVLGKAATIATISDNERKVTLSPANADTILHRSQYNYYLFNLIHFTANSTLPNDQAVFVWNIERALSQHTYIKDLASFNNTIAVNFIDAGTNKVKVDVYDKLGNLWASDSTTITVNVQPVTADMLSATNYIEVIVQPDTTWKDYFRTFVSEGRNSSTIYSVTPSTINCFSIDSGSSGAQGITQRATKSMTGAFSSDLQTITKLDVTRQDKFSIPPNTVQDNNLIFTLSNIKLYSVDNNQIIYAAYKGDVANYLQISEAMIQRYQGNNPNDMSQLPYGITDGKPPFAFIIFRRKQ